MSKDFEMDNLRAEIEEIYDALEAKERGKKEGCYMVFNGTNLGLIRNGKMIDNLDAMSGRQDYQAKKYQNIANLGPIPEGRYFAPQKERQTITPFNAVIGVISRLSGLNKGKWNGGPVAWGIRRVWLHPDENTETYGRNNFSIHGGILKGSKGCIDIAYQTDKLKAYMDECQEKKVPLYVKYKRDYW